MIIGHFNYWSFSSDSEKPKICLLFLIFANTFSSLGLIGHSKRKGHYVHVLLLAIVISGLKRTTEQPKIGWPFSHSCAGK
jgi:hypothetical protein